MSNQSIKLIIESRLEQVPWMGTAVRALCESAGAQRRTAAEIEVAVVEAVNNCILHAYHSQSDCEVCVRCEAECGSMSLVVEDHGSPMDPAKLDDPALRSFPEDRAEMLTGSMGLRILLSVMDEVEYLVGQDGPNRLRMRKSLLAAEARNA